MNIDYDTIQNVTETAATEWAQNLNVEDTRNLAVMIQKAQADAIMSFSKGLAQGVGASAALGVGIFATVEGTKLAAKKIKERKAKKAEETNEEN